MSNEAKTVRAALKKELGLNARAVSVRTSHSTIRVRIHDPKASLDAVREIAKRVESIDRCEATGEILLGGNTYTDVAFSDKAISATVRERAPEVAAIMLTAAKLQHGYGENVAGVRVHHGYAGVELSEADTFGMGGGHWCNPKRPSSVAKALLMITNT